MAISEVAELLGLKEKVRTPLDLVTLSEKGLPKKAVSRLVKLLSINPGEIAPLLLVSRKTVERYKGDLETHLSRSVSERVLRIAIAAQRCSEIFGDTKRCNEWLKSENAALGGRTPLGLMRSDFGIDMVLNELGRIEHGIIS